MAERKRSKKSKDDSEPTKEETAVAKFLRFNVPTKEGKLAEMSSVVVNYFTAEEAINKLLDSKWAVNKGKANATFTTRQSCVAYCQTLLNKGMYQRIDKKEKIKKKSIQKKHDSDVESKKKKNKEKKKETEVVTDKVKSKETKKDKKESSGKKKKVKPLKFILHTSQTFEDSEYSYYAWIYDPVPLKTWVIGTLMVLGSIGVCLFPLWPPEVRQGVYYLSLGAAGLIGVFLSLCVVRTILFCFLWAISFGKRHFWLFPNLTEDCGVLESFSPLYSHKYYCKSKNGSENELETAQTVENDDTEPLLTKNTNDTEDYEVEAEVQNERDLQEKTDDDDISTNENEEPVKEVKYTENPEYSGSDKDILDDNELKKKDFVKKPEDSSSEKDSNVEIENTNSNGNSNSEDNGYEILDAKELEKRED